MYVRRNHGDQVIGDRSGGYYDMNNAMLINMKIDTSETYAQDRVAGAQRAYYLDQEKTENCQDKFLLNQNNICSSEAKGLRIDRIASEMTDRPKKAKHLPLSIANILGQVDSDNEMENDDRDDEDCHIQVCDEEPDNEEATSCVQETGSMDDDSKECKDEKQTQGKTGTSKAVNDKQTPSYTAIIAQAILSSPDKKLPLGSIYDYIAEHFPEFLKKGQGWRNCVRHNLSLSECFIKAGRARNGRGNYWGIHPRYLKNFSKGDFRKRRASHRPRNRDMALGMAADHRLHYPHLISPFMLPSALPVSQGHRSFSVDSILSADRGQSAFNAYKPWLTKPEMQRLSNQCVPPLPWIDQKLHAPIHYTPLYSGLPVASEHSSRHYDLLHRSDLVTWKQPSCRDYGLDIL